MHSLTKLSIAAIIVAMNCLAYSQQDSSSQPLGDIAREQKDKRNQLEKKDKAKKIYTDADLPPASGPDKDLSAATASRDAEERDPTVPKPPIEPAITNEVEQKKAGNPQVSGSSEETNDSLIILAGTQIKADISQVPAGIQLSPHIMSGRVVVPVRIGFTTAIPALTEVTVSVTGHHYDAGYVDVVELIAVKIVGTTYTIHTDQIPLFSTRAGNVREVTFTLMEPLRIPR
ncbi:MAG TPA: hypothetical protein VN577_11805 [Terriglobales bacterium]|nr:hypothetical protein [Terriglobales bacterium]